MLEIFIQRTQDSSNEIPIRYSITHPYALDGLYFPNRTEPYAVRARRVDTGFVLEESEGRGFRNRTENYEGFGIAQKLETAEKRLLKRIKTRARKIQKDLTPRIVDQTKTQISGEK